MNGKRMIAGVALLALVPALAIANEYVYGSGYSMEAAMQAAESRGSQRAAARGTCYKPAEPQNCDKKQDGSWVCHVSVSDYTHQGGGICAR